MTRRTCIMSCTVTAGLGEWISPPGPLDLPSSSAKWASTMKLQKLSTGSQSICSTMAKMEHVLTPAKMACLLPNMISHSRRIQLPTAMWWLQSRLQVTPRLILQFSKVTGWETLILEIRTVTSCWWWITRFQPHFKSPSETKNQSNIVLSYAWTWKAVKIRQTNLERQVLCWQ